MRKLRYSNISEYRKARKRTPKQIETYKVKLSEYRKFLTRERNRKKAERALYEKTRAKLKGKTRNQTKKLWDGYKSSKKTIKKRYSTPDISFKEKTTKVFTTENQYELGAGDPDIMIGRFIDQHINDKGLRYMLIILKGINTTTGEPQFISDSYSKIELIDQKKYRYSIYTDLLSSLTFSKKESGETFEYQTTHIRLTFDK